MQYLKLEQWGCVSGNGVYTDGATTFINAALCDLSYKAKQPAYVFDLPTKTENSEENGLNGVEFGNLNIDVSAVKSDDESWYIWI